MIRNARTLARALALAAALTLVAGTARAGDAAASTGTGTSADTASAATTAAEPRVYHRTMQINGLDIFYREAGPADAPVVLLLHGFPTSSHMYRDLIPRLAGEFRVIAPDYPGYGESATPGRDEYDYTFANAAAIVEKLLEQLGVERFSVYLMDYGAPVGYRLFERNPEAVQSFIIQNGNAYDEGLRDFWEPIKAYWADPTQENRDALRGLLTLEATKWQFYTGARTPEVISPDNWNHIQPKLDRPGNDEIQLDYFYDYRTNVERYPEWQRLFREHQPPALITWGEGDFIFPAEGAYPYQRDLEDVELHILDTGHFALEEDGDLIATLMIDFLRRKIVDADDE
ncbi:MAG: alpha/beta hydrolase [Planctomycetota bacterium]